MENQIQDCRNHVKKIGLQIARLEEERENALKLIEFWSASDAQPESIGQLRGDAGKCCSCEKTGGAKLNLCEIGNKNYPEQCDKRRFGDEG